MEKAQKGRSKKAEDKTDQDPPTPKEVGAIISAYTGILVGEFSEMQKYAEKVLGRPVWTHEFANKEVVKELKEKSKPDLLRVHVWCGGRP